MYFYYIYPKHLWQAWKSVYFGYHIGYFAATIDLHSRQHGKGQLNFNNLDSFFSRLAKSSVKTVLK